MYEASQISSWEEISGNDNVYQRNPLHKIEWVAFHHAFFFSFFFFFTMLFVHWGKKDRKCSHEISDDLCVRKRNPMKYFLS